MEQLWTYLTKHWYRDARLTLYYPRFAYFTCKIQLSEYDRNKLYNYTKSALELARGIVEQNCNQYLVIQIIFNQIILSQTLFSICRIQLQQKEATKIIISFVNNTQSILSQSNLMKTRNLFQCNDDLFTFPFMIWLTFFTFPL